MNHPTYHISEVENGFVLEVGSEMNLGKPSQFQEFHVFTDLKKTFEFIADHWNANLKERSG